MALAETAVQLGIAPNAVKARLFQARAWLVRQLRDLWREGDPASGGGAATTREG
jgi:DNA-directed RNA polymerase specialized sigma24 family protein